VLRELRVMLADYYADVPTLIVEPGVRTGVGVLMDFPREVGSDRICTPRRRTTSSTAGDRGRLRTSTNLTS